MRQVIVDDMSAQPQAQQLPPSLPGDGIAAPGARPRLAASAPRPVRSPYRQAGSASARGLSGQVPGQPLAQQALQAALPRQVGFQRPRPQSPARQQRKVLSPQDIAAAALAAASTAYMPAASQSAPCSPSSLDAFSFLAAALAGARAGGSPPQLVATTALSQPPASQVPDSSAAAEGGASVRTAAARVSGFSAPATLAAGQAADVPPHRTKRTAAEALQGLQPASPQRRPSSSSVENASLASSDFEPAEPARKSKRMRPGQAAAEPAVRASKRLAEARSLDGLDTPLGSMYDLQEPGKHHGLLRGTSVAAAGQAASCNQAGGQAA